MSQDERIETTWHNKNGTIKWSKLYWTYYFTVIVPLVIASWLPLGALQNVISIAMGLSFLPVVVLGVYMIFDLHRRDRNFMMMWREQEQAMNHWDESTPKKLKEIEARYMTRMR